MLWKTFRNRAVIESGAMILVGVMLNLLCANAGAQQHSAKSSSPLFSSPGAVLDYYRQAFANGEWDKCYASLTPQSQNYILFDLAFECMESGSEKAAEICKSHGLDSESLKKEFDKRLKQRGGLGTKNSSNKRGEEELLRREVVAACIRDKADFYEAACSFLQSLQQESPVGALSQLKIDGDKATGVVQVVSTQLSSSRGEASRKAQRTVGQPIKFRKVGGSWLIDML